jgi:hypothetical protein
MKVSWCLALMVAAIGCGKSSDERAGGGSVSGGSAPPAASADRWKPVTRPAVSASCAKARWRLGYAAVCEEQALPELTTAAGQVVRLWNRDDPTKQWVYALVPPTGEPIVAEANPFSDGILRTITDRLDLATTPPEVLAKLYVALDVQAATVRCLGGDALPAGERSSDQPCAPPSIEAVGGKRLLRFLADRFPHPRLLNRTDHWVYGYSVEVKDHELSMVEGDGVMRLDDAAPLPADAPPLPTMTTAPTWAGVPTAAPDDVSRAACAKATELFGWRQRACKAYAYPSLELPTGALLYLANDAGERHVMAVRRPDGAIDLARAVGFQSPLSPLVESYDPAKVPGERFLGAYLLLDGAPKAILCLPGSGDRLPGEECVAPSAAKDGDELVVKAIVHELPLQGGDDPAVRRIEWRFTPRGGMSGGGTRLIDLRSE